jgi:type VI secretion system protein ImpB
MESHQHKLDRVRPPRVHITYDLETEGAMKAIELPFVVGVMADLSGQRKNPLPPLKDRKFVNIDRDNINTVLAQQEPRLAMKVQDKLTGQDQKIGVELNFKHLDDFEPAQVARQVEPLRKLLEMRERLKELTTKLEGNDKLEQLLADVINNTEKAVDLAKAMGIEAGASEAPQTEESK